MSDDNGHGPPHIESAEEARLKLTIESFKRGAAARDAVLATLQAENAELRGRLGTAERDLAKPENWPIEALNETNALFDRARAAEGERDRLRELLACYTGSNRARDTFDFQAEARAALAAIPHAEGEASAPPKETT